jgi:ribosomal protein L37E
MRSLQSHGNPRHSPTGLNGYAARTAVLACSSHRTVVRPYSDTILECRACGETRDPDAFIPDAIAEALDWESYVAMTDGDHEPYVECAVCGLETYVYAEGRCAHCGETPTQECERCGTTIPASEMGCAPLCGYCDHMMSKDD